MRREPRIPASMETRVTKTCQACQGKLLMDPDDRFCDQCRGRRDFLDTVESIGTRIPDDRSVPDGTIKYDAERNTFVLYESPALNQMLDILQPQAERVTVNSRDGRREVEVEMRGRRDGPNRNNNHFINDALRFARIEEAGRELALAHSLVPGIHPRPLFMSEETMRNMAQFVSHETMRDLGAMVGQAVDERMIEMIRNIEVREGRRGNEIEVFVNPPPTPENIHVQIQLPENRPQEERGR